MILQLFDQMRSRAKNFVSRFGDAFSQSDKQKLVIGMGPAPLTIPRTKPDTDTRRGVDVDIAKVKDFRFTFSNGKAQMSWIEEDGSKKVETRDFKLEDDFDDDKRRFFIGGNWKQSGDKEFVEKFGTDVLQEI